MKKVEVTHVRQGHLIKNLVTGEIVNWKTINAAKRHSAIIQRVGVVLRVGKVWS